MHQPRSGWRVRRGALADLHRAITSQAVSCPLQVSRYLQPSLSALSAGPIAIALIPKLGCSTDDIFARSPPLHKESGTCRHTMHPKTTSGKLKPAVASYLEQEPGVQTWYAIWPANIRGSCFSTRQGKLVDLTPRSIDLCQHVVRVSTGDPSFPLQMALDE